MLIDIPPVEAQYIEVVSALRHSRHLTRQSTAKLGQDGRDEDLVGCAGEYAASLALDLSWRPVVEDPRDDISADIGQVGKVEVRTTLRPSSRSLILYPRDDDAAQFVLVRRINPHRYSVDGWIMGKDGKDDSYWREDVRSPAYFVPHTVLRPLDQLRRGLEKLRASQ